MKIGMLIGGAVVVLVAVGAGVACMGDGKVDRCLSKAAAQHKVLATNAYVHSCEGDIYLPTSDVSAPFKQVKGWRAQEIEVLPFRFLRKGEYVYFVATVGGTGFESVYEMQLLIGLDAATAQPISESKIQDARQVFTVFKDYFVAEPRAQSSE